MDTSRSSKISLAEAADKFGIKCVEETKTIKHIVDFGPSIWAFGRQRFSTQLLLALGPSIALIALIKLL